jgi:hypothetical protein
MTVTRKIPKPMNSAITRDVISDMLMREESGGPGSHFESNLD